VSPGGQDTAGKALVQHPVQAILLMLGAVFFLSSMDVAFKLLVEHYSSFQVVFFRSALSLPVFAIWIVATDLSRFRTAYFGGHLLRGVLGLVMLYAVGECFRELQLADAYTLFFAAPLVITLLSGPVLGEPAGPVRIAAAVIGFVGVLVVLKPGGGDWLSYGAAMGLAGMLAYAFTTLLLRRLGGRDSTVTIVFWFMAIVCLGSGLLAIPQWQPVDRAHWPHILLIGLTGVFGQAMLTAAFRRASVAVVAPFDYTHMLWAVVYGLAFWGYLPGWRVWIGASIIVLSGLYILLREGRLSRRRARRGAPPP
jgi:drug/metabolite transporter (DMT)-like permease